MSPPCSSRRICTASGCPRPRLAMIDVVHPTGLLREAECFDAIARLPEASTDQVDRLGPGRGAPGRGPRGDRHPRLRVHRHPGDLAPDGSPSAARLPVRVRAAIYRGLLDDALDTGYRTGDVVPDTGGLVTVGPCKVLMDGSLNTRTALCHDAYPGLSGIDAHGSAHPGPRGTGRHDGRRRCPRHPVRGARHRRSREHAGAGLLPTGRHARAHRARPAGLGRPTCPGSPRSA